MKRLHLIISWSTAIRRKWESIFLTDLVHRDDTLTFGVVHNTVPEIGVRVHRCEPSGEEVDGFHEGVHSARMIAEKDMGTGFWDLSAAWAQRT